MDTVVRNFDGINFLVVEKSWYSPDKIVEINEHFLTGNEPIYFTAHYPLYAGLMWVLDVFTTGPNALLISVIVSNMLLAAGLYIFFLEVLGKKKLAIFLASLSLFFPARMMAVRGVGSTEPIFMFFILMSLAYSARDRYWKSALMGALAVLTRSPGIILFIAYAIAGWIKVDGKMREYSRYIFPYLIMPLSLIALWLFYGEKFGSFFAYFQSGDNIHLFVPPFQIFSNMQSWSSGIWLEDAVYTYLFYGAGIYLFSRMYWGNKKLVATVLFGLIYMLLIPFIAHRDIARYSLPIAPLAVASYGVYLRGRGKWLLLLLIIPAVLWGWNFVLENVQPVNDWSVLL